MWRCVEGPKRIDSVRKGFEFHNVVLGKATTATLNLTKREPAVWQEQNHVGFADDSRAIEELDPRVNAVQAATE